MFRDPVRYPAGIPKWFTYALHVKEKWRLCRKNGHDGHYICMQCGQILQPLPPGMP